MIRGGVVDHPRYAGERRLRFGDQPHPPLPRADRLPVLPGPRPRLREQDLPRARRTDDGTTEKLWIAAVEQLRDRRRLPAAPRDGPRDRDPRRRACTCRRARRGSSRAPPTCGCRGSSATAPRARRSCPAGSGRPASRRRAASVDEVVRAGRDGRGARRADRGADELRAGQRGRQPARAARRAGAARPVPRVHGHATPASRPTVTSARRSSATSRSTGMRAPSTPSDAADLGPARDAAARAARGAAARAPARDGRARAAAASRSAPSGWRQAGIAAADDDLHSLDDLARLPFTTQGRPARRTIRSACWPCRARSSCASTRRAARHGKPTVVGYTRADLETWTELMARCMTMAGVRPGMVIHNANGYGLFTGGLGFHQGGERIGATVVPVSGGLHRPAGDAAARSRRPGPGRDAVVRARDRAGAAPRPGSSRRRCRCELGLFGGEPWTEADAGRDRARAAG